MNKELLWAGLVGTILFGALGSSHLWCYILAAISLVVAVAALFK